jgi:soluble lytic murein transglycosylase-like protein
MIKLLRQAGRHALTSFAMIVILSFTILQNAIAYWSVDRIEQIIIQESLKSKFVSPSLALAVAETESSFRPHVVSHAGAVGVMQIMPSTAYDMYKVKQEDLFDPQTNIRIGVQFLDHLIRKYKGRIDLALSHYNGGSRVIRDGKAQILPYTLDYVVRILARSKHYKVALASDSQLKTRKELAVQMSNNHAKPKKGARVSPHINHVDNWLTFIEELIPIGRR